MSIDLFTPKSMWTDFDENLPLEKEVISGYVQDGTTYNKCYILGRKVDSGRTKILVNYCQSEKKSKKAILFVGDKNQNIDFEELKFLSQFGNVFSFDYVGIDDKKEYYTLYPFEIKYANLKFAERHLNFADESAKTTCLYEWTATAKYVISFIKSMGYSDILVMGVGVGGNISTILCGSDARLCAGASIFGAGGEKFAKDYKYQPHNLELSEENLRYIAGIDASSYAQHIKIPFLFLTSTNNTYFDFDRSFDMLEKIDEKLVYFSQSPRLNCCLSPEEFSNLNMFVDAFLSKKEIKLDSFIKLSVQIVENQAKFEIENLEDYQDLQLFFCKDETNPSVRNWVNAKANEDIEIFAGEKKLFVFAKAKTKNGFYACSKLFCIDLKDAKNCRENSNTRMIYSNSNQMGTMTCFCEKMPKVADLFLKRGDVRFCEGANNLFGITSTNNKLCTFNISEKRQKTEKTICLNFNVYSKQKQTLNLVLIENYQKDNEQRYECDIDVFGGDLWQNINILLDDIKNNIGKPLLDLSCVDILLINSQFEAIFNNIILI